MFVYQRVVPFSVTWLRKPGKNRNQVVNDWGWARICENPPNDEIFLRYSPV